MLRTGRMGLQLSMGKSPRAIMGLKDDVIPLATRIRHLAYSPDMLGSSVWHGRVAAAPFIGQLGPRIFDADTTIFIFRARHTNCLHVHMDALEKTRRGERRRLSFLQRISQGRRRPYGDKLVCFTRTATPAVPPTEIPLPADERSSG